MSAASGDHRHLRVVPDDVMDRPVDVGGGRLKTEVPCCDLDLELPDELGAIRQAGCPRCQLAYTVELVVVNGVRWARFAAIGPIAIASPRRPPPAEGLAWTPLGRRTHLVTVDNTVIGIITRDTASNSFTARQYGASGKLPRVFSTVEAAALALGSAHALPT
jgi:hypothetical protein